MGFRIRDVKSDDADSIVAILNPIIETGKFSAFDTPFTVEAERQYINAFPARGVFLVAISEEERIVGFQSMEPFATYTHAFDHVGVLGTYVDLAWRRRGVASCLLVVFLSWRMGIVDEEGVPVHLLPRASVYAPWLFKEIFKSNLDVARRSLAPGRVDVGPQFFDTPTTQRSDLGRVIYANSITLTPGTVSVWVHGRAITVHAIAEEVADGLAEGEMDRRVTWLEGNGE